VFSFTLKHQNYSQKKCPVTLSFVRRAERVHFVFSGNGSTEPVNYLNAAGELGRCWPSIHFMWLMNNMKCTEKSTGSEISLGRGQCDLNVVVVVVEVGDTRWRGTDFRRSLHTEQLLFVH
jgi:hypothetical protein